MQKQGRAGRGVEQIDAETGGGELSLGEIYSILYPLHLLIIPSINYLSLSLSLVFG